MTTIQIKLHCVVKEIRSFGRGSVALGVFHRCCALQDSSSAEVDVVGMVINVNRSWLSLIASSITKRHPPHMLKSVTPTILLRRTGQTSSL
jgi:hypothetical protein